MNNAFLIGKEIYLRPLDREDADLVRSWLNDPEVRAHLQWYRPLSRRAEEEFIDRVGQSEHDLVLLIVLKEWDCPIGVAGLHDIDVKNRHALFGICIGVKEQWGKGHGSDATRLIVGHAFETLNLNRVFLRVYEDNARGIRAYERVGFKREGLLRQDNFRHGRYWDTIVMGILREEWKA
jgi:RimJ/RimL family protein N-acetyltransferase